MDNNDDEDKQLHQQISGLLSGELDNFSLFNFHPGPSQQQQPLYLNLGGDGSGGDVSGLSSLLFDGGIPQIDGMYHGRQIVADHMYDSEKVFPISTRVDQACRMCRRRKVKCDGQRPACSFCQTKGFACAYEPASSSGAGGPRKRRKKQAAQEVVMMEVSDSDGDGDGESSESGDNAANGLDAL
ncbi:hypothetical protein GGI21_004559, partial [Coemansia aciculifera]